MAFNAGTVVSYMILNTEKFSKGIDAAKKDVQTFTRTSGTMGEKLTTVGGIFTSVGKKATLGLTVPLAGVGTAAVMTSSTFQAEMSKVGAISGATGEEMKKLEALAREMGATTKFSASESAQALQYMAMAGWNTEQMMAGLPGVMSLAAASGEDLALTSDIVTDALTAFGMQASESGKFADLLASASSNSNTNVAMMGETFKYVAPLFGALGYSAEDAALATGLMANAGIKGSQAGTSLRAAVTNLVNPTSRMAEAMEALGIKVTDANGEMLPFSDLMVDMRGKFAGLTEEQKSQYAATIFGKEAMSGMLAILNASEEDFNKLTKATNDYTGAAKEMADKMEDNLQGELTKLKSALEELAISIGTIIIPVVRDFIAWIQKWVDKFNSLDDSTKKTIVQIGAVVMAVGPLLIAFGQMVKTVGLVTTGIKALTAAQGLLSIAKLKDKAETLVLLGLYAKDAVAKAASATATGAMTAATTAYNIAAGIASTVTTALAGAIAFLLSPIGLVIAAVAAFTAGIIYLWKTNEGFRDAVIKIWEVIKTSVVNGSKAFLDFAKSIPEFFKNLPSTMLGIGKNIIQGLLNGVTSLAGKVQDTISNIANGISNGFKRILGIRSPSRVFEEYGKYIDEGLAKGIKDNKGTVLDQTRAVAEGIKKTMESNIESINKLGEALVTALKKQYEQMEREQLKALDKEVNNAKKASDEKIKMYDREYTEKLKLIDEEAYRQVKALEDEIDGIDALTDAEDKAMRDKEHRDKLNELNKKLMSAETAEERLDIEKEINDTIARYERTLLLERRKEQKDNLREEIQAIKDSASEKKEALKLEYEEKKKIEKDNLEAKIEALENEKKAIEDHYKELTTKEALEAEARKLVIAKDNDAIIDLLQEYNPHWQDAGQSFADSVINGLNSKKQDMKDAIGETLDFQDTVTEQITVLEQLEEKIAQLTEADKKKQGSSGGSIGAGLDGIGALKGAVDEVLPELDEFGNAVTTTTAKSAEEFIDLERQASLALTKLAWTGSEITDEMKNDLVSKYTEMKNSIVDKLKEQKEDALAELQTLLDSSKDMTDEEKEEILKITGEKYDEQIKKTEEGHKRLLEIIEEGKKDGLGITEERRKEMMKIQEGMRSDAIDVLTETKDESEKLLKDLKDNADKLTTEMVSEVIKNSIKQRDETIKNAEEQYEKVMAEVTKLREEGSEEAKKTADAIEKEAKRQRDEAVKAAEDMHDKVIAEAQKQSESHIKEIDFETGEIMTRWDKLKRWFVDNPIVRFFKTKEDPVPDAVSGAAPRIGRNAAGTQNWRGGLTTVGEYGKELIELPKGTKIFNNQTTQLLERNEGNGRPILLEANNKIYLDGREIAQVVSKHQYDLEQDSGRGRGLVY